MLILTEECNLRCSYCYEQEKEYDRRRKMDWQTAKSALDIFLCQAPLDGQANSIAFFGGEPTLEFDLLRRGVEYSLAHPAIASYQGNRYNYVINTNGTILSQEMVSLYRELGRRINIRISVDGYGHDQDVMRKTSLGGGSWKLLARNLPVFRELRERHGVQVSIISTINKATCRHISQNHIALHDLTGMQIGVLFSHEEDWDEESSQAIRREVLLLHDRCVRRGMRLPLCDVRRGKSRSGRFARTTGSVCSAGVTSITVTPSGDIYPCHRFYYYGLGNEFRMGSLDSGLDSRKIHLLARINCMGQLPDKCQQCHPVTRRRCRLCVACNMRISGDFYKVPEWFCALTRGLYQQLLQKEMRAQA